MPGEETRATSDSGGEKGRKPERLALIPPEPLWALSRVYAMGAEKYADHNYLQGFPWSWSLDAAMRHLTQWMAGEDNDPESGESHLMHVAWHTFALWMFQEHELGEDDRLSTAVPETRPRTRTQQTGRRGEAFERSAPAPEFLIDRLPMDARCTCGHLLGDHHVLVNTCSKPQCSCPGFEEA